MNGYFIITVITVSFLVLVVYYIIHNTKKDEELYSKITQSDKETPKCSTESEVINYVTDEDLELNNFLDRFRINHLYHMTHISNLKNILDFDLLSHNRAHSLGFNQADISNSEVNSRRCRIHDFVPLYFTPRNPMLYSRKHVQNELVILCVDRTILKDNVVFSDGNAASGTTKFYTRLEDLTKINWKVVRANYWNGFEDGKRIRCSEVLKRDAIGVNSILKIVCFDQKSLDYVKNINSNCDIPTEINKNYFF